MPADPPPRERSVIGKRYVLEAVIGSGGMGQIWRARHIALKSTVAIKLLHAGFAASDSARRRFLTEAQLTATLKTRHAVQVFDFGVTDDGLPFLVMELLEGEGLDRRIASAAPLSIVETVHLLRQAARALARAHALGIVHRDFKPANVLLHTSDDGEEVKIVDFGIAKLLGSLEEAMPVPEETTDDLARLESLSRTGGIVGTPYYMAPEQVRGAIDVGPAADVWALGVVAYECLTGRRPFRAETVPLLLVQIVHHKFEPASVVNPALDVVFDAWFTRTCALDPSERFADPVSAIEALATAFGIATPTPTPIPKRHSDPALPFQSGDLVALADTDRFDGDVDPEHKVSLIDLIAIIVVVATVAIGLFVVLR